MPPPSSWSVQVEAGGDCVVAAAVPDGYEQPGWLITGRFSGSVAFGALVGTFSLGKMSRGFRRLTPLNYVIGCLFWALFSMIQNIMSLCLHSVRGA